VVDHSTHGLKIVGSSPATGNGREKMAKKFDCVIKKS